MHAEALLAHYLLGWWVAAREASFLQPVKNKRVRPPLCASGPLINAKLITFAFASIPGLPGVAGHPRGQGAQGSAAAARLPRMGPVSFESIILRRCPWFIPVLRGCRVAWDFRSVGVIVEVAKATRDKAKEAEDKGDAKANGAGVLCVICFICFLPVVYPFLSQAKDIFLLLSSRDRVVLPVRSRAVAGRGARDRGQAGVRAGAQRGRIARGDPGFSYCVW